MRTRWTRTLPICKPTEYRECFRWPITCGWKSRNYIEIPRDFCAPIESASGNRGGRLGRNAAASLFIKRCLLPKLAMATLNMHRPSIRGFPCLPYRLRLGWIRKARSFSVWLGNCPTIRMPFHENFCILRHSESTSPFVELSPRLVILSTSFDCFAFDG